MKKFFLKSLLFISIISHFGYAANAETAGVLQDKNTNPIIVIDESTALIQDEIVLGSGKSIQFNVGGYIDKYFTSKYKLKIKIDSQKNEPIILRRIGVYPQNGTRRNSFNFSSNNLVFNYTLAKDAIPVNNQVNTGSETFIITNLSSIPLKFKAGISSGIYVRGLIEEFDDIDFNL